MKTEKIFPHVPDNLSGWIHMLGDLLGRVITELESREIFDTEELIRSSSKKRRSGDASARGTLLNLVSALTPRKARAIASAFTVYFDLVNLAEDNDHVRNMLDQEKESFPGPAPGSIAEAVETMKINGVSKQKFGDLLENLSIELVLTAHPTEAKRRTILSKLNRISEILGDLSRPGLPPALIEEKTESLHALIMELWLTDRSRTTRPGVTDEVRTGLFFIDEIFWPLLPKIYDSLDRALDTYYPGLKSRPSWLSLASWIGGDRDGNPNVTAEVTAETLRLHRGLAVEKHRTALRDLSRSLSISIDRLPPPRALTEWIDRRRPFPPHVSYIEQRYKTEPYRLALSLCSADLARASEDDMKAKLLSDEHYTALIRQDDVESLLRTIVENLPAPIAGADAHRVLRQVQIFGLHSARLHLREDSSGIRSALAEVLRGLGIEINFEKMNDKERSGLITNLLGKKPPPLSRHPGLTGGTAETMSVFQLASRARSIYGKNLIGPFIISMTKSPSDILSALLIARWMGCEECLSIIPLIETIESLERAGEIMRELFSNPEYREHLEIKHNRQTVMIGYSDTNKDGGYLSANWALYRAQEEIVKAAEDNGVTLTIFHGRGGTAARGGGPSSQAIRSQPPGSVNGRLRLTEQGEVISSRYSNPVLARRHIEEIVNSVLLSSFSKTTAFKPVPAKWRAAMSDMSLKAIAGYRSLIFDTPGFFSFWQGATPIDEIRRLHIGSRPTARNSGEESINNTRAIPWVFSWMQSRFNLPGWYGLGTGLLSCPDRGLQKEMYNVWPFFSSIIRNTGMSLSIADMEIARMYAGLVPDMKIRNGIYSVILEEYKKTEEGILSITGESSLLDNEPRLQRSIRLRNPYADPLNYLQVELLRRLRTIDPEGPEASELREAVVITINGIASGLRNTG